MSLPLILKYVYNHGTEEVIKRGKKIFATSGVQMLDADHFIEQVRFRVRNDLYQNYYTVTVNNYLNTKELAIRCQCPYNLGDICRHEVAALFQLNEILQSGFFENTNVVYDQRHTVVRMRQITKQMLMIFTDATVLEHAERMANATKATIIANKHDQVDADVPDEDKTYRVSIKQNEERYFDTYCGCDEKKHPICLHKAIVFLQVLKQFGAQYFQSGQNRDIQKNKLLEQYGYTLKDDLTNKFQFTYEGGKPFLRVLDPSIKKLVNYQRTEMVPKESIAAAVVEVREKKRLGILLDIAYKDFPYANIILIEGVPDELEMKFKGAINRLELNQYINQNIYCDDDKDLLQAARKIQPEELLKYIRKNAPFGEFIPESETVLGANPPEDIRRQAWEYLLPKYQRLIDRYSEHKYLYARRKGKLISSTALDKIEFGKIAHPQLLVTSANGAYTINLEWIIDHSSHPAGEVQLINAALLMKDGCLHAMGSIDEVLIAEYFPPDGLLNITSDEWNKMLENQIMVWNTQVHVHFSEELIERIDRQRPTLRVYLQERDHILVIKPAFVYSDVEVKPVNQGDVLIPHDGIVKIIQRNDEAEEEFMELIKSTHGDLHLNKKERIFSLSEMAVLSGNWFRRFSELMADCNAEIIGYEGLRTMKANINKPVTQIMVSSGIDWFDADIEIKFGANTVTVADVKKALAQKQNFVRLGDGSLGILPDEWVKKYGLLFKVGESKSGKIRLKKYHFSVLDDLLSELDERTQLNELVQKREKLERILTDDHTTVQPPKNLAAVLRPYQLAGFQWLKFLNESGWGGILADDMGLGKTVQTLTFFQYYKNEHPDSKFLVICPTTLMYNWENEIEKFTPTMKRYIHHGPKRVTSMKTFEAFDIIITTYGTMRSDIKAFKDIPFDYVVLDESQSIKNPQSQVARASLLLNCKFRLALSGTPVQNNTFDLYAQMNFLNPGMLGSREFFMNEFATPIDKFREDEVKRQLKRLTYPFLLRRSKEQVAKDLPAKTETILYCEMGDDQRKIYDAYRNAYRSQILGMIEERGMDKSQMHILQGLTKLRQICDSPAILNEEQKFHNHSVKLDELTREIAENIGEHKALIFSQFLGMLALIKDKLNHAKIPYVYFDGSSSSVEREAAIYEFQNNHECRVFLISLKAGGIGLNLTAADYVYIVDPWWNPAVEQQAIDRTHRIGQTKNIFAYRLICKDTLEEKMLQLQEQKRILASELVSDDNALMKRLTKDDIAFLFS